jgi:uncharacterized membrane protein
MVERALFAVLFASIFFTVAGSISMYVVPTEGFLGFSSEVSQFIAGTGLALITLSVAAQYMPDTSKARNSSLLS